MKVITVINNPNHPGFNLLRLSCSINNLELLALVCMQNEFYSNRIKDEILLNYLEHHVNDDEIFLFTDGYDTILLCNEDEILQKFNQTGKNLVFSAESACWPDKSLASLYPPATSGYRFLNSGGFIGKAGIIKQLLKDDLLVDNFFEKSNQYIWAKRFFKYPDIIALDTACEIFHTFSPEVGECYWPAELPNNSEAYYSCMKQWFTTNFSIEKGRIFSKISGTWPCHAHFNGYSKHIMDFDIVNMVFSNIANARPACFIEGAFNSPIAS